MLEWMSKGNTWIRPASGVGILLSQRFAAKVLAQGSVGSRIVWVRIDGPVCPLFIVCVYVRHKYKKTAPLATDVIEQLDDLLSNCKKLKSTDCIVVMAGRSELRARAQCTRLYR